MTARIPRIGSVFLAGTLSIIATQAIRGQDLSSARATDPTPTSDKTLSPPHRRVVFDSTPFSAGSFAPQWDKGYLVSRNLPVSSPDQWAVRLYDVNGVKALETTIWFPGATRVVVSSAAVTPDGRIVASGFAEKSDGTPAAFLAVTDKAGKMTDVIRTNPYRAFKSCVAPDGTVWTFGSSREFVGGERRDLMDAPMLRRFDFDKGELTALLPRSSFSTHHNPALSYGEGGNLAFRCSADRVAVYTEVAGEYIEVDYATQAVRRWRIDAAGQDLPLSETIAVTSSGEVYALLGRNSNPAGPRGLFHLQRIAATGTVRWLPVAGQVHERSGWDVGLVSHLLGADGDALVFVNRENQSAVQWARLLQK